ncbi:lysylphosphatidylglycerol synthase domain-containing protein [Crocinitomix catalasitica]|uniref:lysylphosphatidylglycerol synthase domain-containing protein n=1 Tax=Crocinitomix catalasitica TaxID=184607 RepID=UPI00090791A2|nr:lysylphosphatidylglycerol synthase domain-containing protein [Crocinitomix catalasitica]
MKTRKSIIFSLKILFASVLLFYIINKLIKDDFLGQLSAIQFVGSQYIYFTVFLLLMPFNWLIEAVKWRFLMSTLKSMSLRSAFAGVLAGISTGILTPNRLGNFVGRTYKLEKNIKTKSILLTLLSNLSQFIITVVFGLVALIFYMLILGSFKTKLIVIIIILGLFVGFWLYFKPSILLKTWFKKILNTSLIDGILFIDQSSVKVKVITLFYAALRYVVFLSQYVLLLLAFGQTQKLYLLYIGVGLVYLVMTILPSLTFGKLFVREASALFVLTKIGVPNTVIILTGFVLWLINVAIPSLIGGSLLIAKK